MDWPRPSLGSKLFVSYLVVVLVGLATLFLAVDALAPSFFAIHLQMMGPGGMGGMMAGAWAQEIDRQLDDAFRAALTQALLIAAGVATLVAIAVSLFVSRQVSRPVRRMLVASRRIAAGHYAERVAIAPANTGDELGQLGASFNLMAASLEQTERRRQELIGDVAHELRTPLATLQGYLEGLLDGVVEPSDVTWAKLHDETGRLRRLVDDLRELSRAEAGEISLAPRPVTLTSIIQTTVERLAASFAEKGLELDQSIAADLPPVRADPDRAAQVLTNLLTNALRYTPAPGRVTVRAERRGNDVAIAVADTGIGVAPEHLDRLFERFYRVDKSRSRAFGGSGVGLTIARALADAMGGRIWAESAGPGQGSSFTFTLPIDR